MRILHTADWHLGHRLYDQDRTPEHEAALQWLLETIETERVDVVIVAGDVFDVTNPSNQARKLYYQFLAGLMQSSAQATVIVGGNHDSPSMLDAPAEVFGHINIHVIGSARPQVQSEVVRLRIERDGKEEYLVVAAVPFLRERDVRYAKFGESSEERMAALKQGIQQHFEDVAEAALAARESPEEPIVATGHLFVSSATDAEDKKSHIYQADENNMEAGRFPACFDYVALGHVHRAQSIDGQDRIRYSGSLVPLTFVEGQRARSVRIIDVGKAGARIATRKVFAPGFRPLHRLHGSPEKVKSGIIAAVTEFMAREDAGALVPWAEVRVQPEERLPNLNEFLRLAVEEVTGPDHPTEVIKFIRRSQDLPSTAPAAAQRDTRQLDELDPEDVFLRVCQTEQLTPETTAEVVSDFRSLRNYLQDQDKSTPA